MRRAGWWIAVALALALPARADEPPAAAVLADLPFLAAQPNQVKIDLGTRGGQALPLLLDTGALQSFATAGGARAIGITPRRNKVPPYRRETVLGRDLQIFVDTRRSDTAAGVGGDYALVGAPFLANYVLEVDFPARRVRFLDPERYSVPDAEPGAAVLPLRRGTLRPVIELEIGDARVPAVIATGAPGTLIVPGGWAEQASVRPDPEATAALELPPGSGAMEAGTAGRVRIGPFEERDVPLLVAPRGLFEAGARSEAVLGVDFLKRFALRIDYPRGRIWLRDGTKPAKSPPPHP